MAEHEWTRAAGITDAIARSAVNAASQAAQLGLQPSLHEPK